MYPQPLTKAGELDNRIDQALSQMGRYSSTSELLTRRLLRECESLIEIDAPSAYHLIAYIHCFCGNRKKALDAIENAQLLGYPLANIKRAAILANLGYTTESLESVKMSINSQEPVQFQELMEVGICAAGFHAVVSAVDSTVANKVLKLDPRMLQLTREAATLIDALGCPENLVGRMADCAGEIMRQRNLLWVHRTPQVSIVETDSEHKTLQFTYTVDVTHEDAAQMNWELAGKLIDADLWPNPTTNIVVNFQGTTLEVPA